MIQVRSCIEIYMYGSSREVILVAGTLNTLGNCDECSRHSDGKTIHVTLLFHQNFSFGIVYKHSHEDAIDSLLSYIKAQKQNTSSFLKFTDLVR
jgi:hypothetical protein